MDSFQAKIGWKRMRQRENKNYYSVPFPPDAIHFKPKQVVKYREREKIKIPSWHYGIL